VKVTIRNLTQKNIKDIPKPCRTCLYWETSTFSSKQLSQTEEAKNEREKAVWLLGTLKEFGNCGKILYVDNKAVGYAQYSLPKRLPNTQNYGAKTLKTTEENAAFISCLYISNKSFRGKGLGERLFDEVITDLKQRGFKAVETFARKGSANNPSGPVELYLKKRFHVKEDIDKDFALVRLEL